MNDALYYEYDAFNGMFETIWVKSHLKSSQNTLPKMSNPDCFNN